MTVSSQSGARTIRVFWRSSQALAIAKSRTNQLQRATIYLGLEAEEKNVVRLECVSYKESMHAKCANKRRWTRIELELMDY